jgi:hypothetical protein
MLADARRNNLAEGPDNVLRVGRMDVFERRRSDGTALAEQARVGWTVVQPPPVAVENRHEAVDVLGDQAEQPFLIAQDVFRLFARADVGQDQGHDQGAILVAGGGGRQKGPELRAVVPIQSSDATNEFSGWIKEIIDGPVVCEGLQ